MEQGKRYTHSSMAVVGKISLLIVSCSLGELSRNQIYVLRFVSNFAQEVFCPSSLSSSLHQPTIAPPRLLLLRPTYAHPIIIAPSSSSSLVRPQGKKGPALPHPLTHFHASPSNAKDSSSSLSSCFRISQSSNLSLSISLFLSLNFELKSGLGEGGGERGQ